MTVPVSDDGVGMDQETPPADGASGHWAITGLRERAGRIDARLRILSARDKGTEVRVQVAASRAFVTRPSRRPLWAFLRQWRRGSPDAA